MFDILLSILDSSALPFDLFPLPFPLRNLVCIFHLQLGMNSVGADDSFLETMKRPFCNAFTGCGRKRFEDSSVDDLVQLSQKILGEAKAWENFQRRLPDKRRRK